MSPIISNREQFYSVREVAERLGVSVRRVRQLIIARGIATQKAANVILIAAEDLRRLEREKRRTGRPKVRR